MSFTASLDDLVATNANGLLSAHPSWVRVRLGDVCEVQNGFPYPSTGFGKSSGFPLLRIRDIRSSQPETFFDGPVDEDFIVRHGDLVVGMDGDFNCARWQGPPALLNQRVCRLSPRDGEFSPEFLYYVLQGYLNAVNAHTSAITVKHLSSRTVEDLPLPLPPLPEQERIAGELDDYVSRLDAAQAALHRVQRNLARYRASVLHAAVTGRLVPTEAELARAEGREYEPASALLTRILGERRRRWEEAELAKMVAAGKAPKDGRWKGRYEEAVAAETDGLPELPEGWCWAGISEWLAAGRQGMTTGPFGSLLKKHEHVAEGIPVLGIENVEPLRYVTGAKIHVTLKKARELERYDAQPGDLLITRSGTVGRVCVVPEGIKMARFSTNIMRIRMLAPSPTAAWFALALTGSQLVRDQVGDLSKGTTHSFLNQRIIAQLAFPVPPLSEQVRVLAEVDRQLTDIQAIQSVLESNVSRLTRLRQSILRLAFEGRLVDQDPTDEPAAVLLERIRAERAADSGSARRRERRLSAVTQERLL